VGKGGSFQIRSRRRVLPSGAVLDLVSGRDGVTGWVEGSAAKAVHGVNFPAVSLSEAEEAGRFWLSEAEAFCEFDGSMRLNRLDVVRDFDLGARGDEVLRSVGSMVHGGRAVRAVYRDPTSNHALTVWARTKRAGGGRLYDKGYESGVEAAQGVIRFEGQERVATLRRSGIEGFQSLAVEDLDEIARRRWEWCRFGDRVLPVDVVVARIWQEQTWRVDTRLKLIGWVASGRPRLSARNTEWRYRSRLAQIGQPAAVGEGWRLDFDEGLIAA
jgi:hypothetical protein